MSSDRPEINQGCVLQGNSQNASGPSDAHDRPASDGDHRPDSTHRYDGDNRHDGDDGSVAGADRAARAARL